MKCTACGKDHKLKDVLYTEDRLPYCANPFTCNDKHPNSVSNIVARGGAEKMYTEAELEDTIYDRLDIDDEMKDRITKIISKPQSIRLSKPDTAYYLIQLQEQMGFDSLAETIRYCVTETAKTNPIENGVLAEPEVAVTKEPEVVHHEEPDRPAVPEVHVPQEEDDFTF